MLFYINPTEARLRSTRDLFGSPSTSSSPAAATSDIEECIRQIRILETAEEILKDQALLVRKRRNSKRHRAELERLQSAVLDICLKRREACERLREMTYNSQCNMCSEVSPPSSDYVTASCCDCKLL